MMQIEGNNKSSCKIYTKHEIGYLTEDCDKKEEDRSEKME